MTLIKMVCFANACCNLHRKQQKINGLSDNLDEIVDEEIQGIAVKPDKLDYKINLTHGTQQGFLSPQAKYFLATFCL